MNEIISRIWQGEIITLSEFIESFGAIFELLLSFEKTEQAPEWHAEGNVYIHTQLVLNEIYKIILSDAKHLAPDKKTALVLAAFLHDIAKPLVTKTKEIDGVERIIAPRHEERGCSYLSYKLLELDIPYSLVQQVLRLVAYHHKPRQLVQHSAVKGDFYHLARLVDVELLFYLAKADILGRSCVGHQLQINYVDLFRLFCEEYALWGIPDPYHEWKAFFNTELSHLTSESRDAVLGYAIKDFEAGLIFTAEEAIARRYSHLQSFPELIVMCGPSGSGKSSWIEANLKDYHKISLDDLREQYGKHRSNQSDNSFILSMAKEQLKIHLRNHEKVVWDATNLRKDFRSMICQLGIDYHALVTLVVLHIPESEIYQGNKSREHKVDREVLCNQLDLLEWIEDSEAHRIVFVNHAECLDLKGTCSSFPSF